MQILTKRVMNRLIILTTSNALLINQAVLSNSYFLRFKYSFSSGILNW